MTLSLRLIALCGVLAAAGCASPIDVPASLEVTQLSSGWFDAGLDSLGRNKIVPVVSFRLENETTKELGYLQINAVFRREGENEGWGTKFVRVVGTDGIPPGAASELLTLDSSGRNATAHDFDPDSIVQWGWNGGLTFFWQRHLVRGFGGDFCVNVDCTQMRFTDPATIEAVV